MAYIENVNACDVRTTYVNGFKMPFKRFDGIDFNFWPSMPKNIEEHLKEYSNLEIRPDDVFICTHPRSGTQWTNEIVKMLKNGESSYQNEHFDWFDRVRTDVLDKMASPRIGISHFPFKYLPKQLAEKGKIICVFRNPKDIVVSYYHLLSRFKVAKFDGNFEDFLEIFLSGNLLFISGAFHRNCFMPFICFITVPNGSWFDYVKSWENAIVNNTNNPILVLYYESMKKDLRRQVDRIANFLEIPYSDELFSNIAEKCEADNMIPEKQSNIPHAVAIQCMDKGHFLYRKGQIGDWKNWFTVAQSEKFDMVYEERMKDSKLSFDY